MPKTKKVKVNPEVSVDVVDEVVEPVKTSTPVESEARQLLRKIYAINKEQYPEIYVLKEKDKELSKKLNLLQ